jgi:hypothetical protein
VPVVNLENTSTIINASIQNITISAIKAHEQFLNVCDLMSVPERQIKEIRDGSYASIEQEVKGKGS